MSLVVVSIFTLYFSSSLSMSSSLFEGKRTPRMSFVQDSILGSQAVRMVLHYHSSTLQAVKKLCESICICASCGGSSHNARCKMLVPFFWEAWPTMSPSIHASAWADHYRFWCKVVAGIRCILRWERQVSFQLPTAFGHSQFISFILHPLYD